MNYKDAIIDALCRLNGEAHINDICDYIFKNKTLDYIDNNPNWKEQISNSITTHSSDSKSFKGSEDIFYTPEYRSGIWGYRAYKEIFDIHDEEPINRGFVEGNKITVLVNKYERNPQARTLCISYYRAKNNGRIKCEICNFDFGKIYGEEFSEKIHIHHIKEISSIGEEYEVDAIADLLPVCPNCHMIAHSKTPAYTPDEIREMIGKTKNGE